MEKGSQRHGAQASTTDLVELLKMYLLSTVYQDIMSSFERPKFYEAA